MTDDLEQLGSLLSALPPAPEAWVAAAREIPKVGAELDALLRRAAADAELRSKLIEDLESALNEAGIAPTRWAVAEARARLSSF
ncbi:MAG TPA: hypothetical protein VI408_04045 [Gaiellaceae bacterium]